MQSRKKGRGQDDGTEGGIGDQIIRIGDQIIRRVEVVQ